MFFPGMYYCQKENAADDKKLMAGSQRVPWGLGKYLGDFGSLYRLAYLCQQKKKCFFLTHLENQDGSYLFKGMFIVPMGTRQGLVHSEIPKVIPKM